MNKRLAILSTALIASCAHADLTMSSSSDGCTVQTPAGSAELSLTPPCSMVKVGTEGKNYYRYDDKRVYVVAGKPAPMDKLEKWSVEASDHCSLDIQGVVVSDERIATSDVQSGMLACPELGVDEKVYRGLAESAR